MALLSAIVLIYCLSYDDIQCGLLHPRWNVVVVVVVVSFCFFLSIWFIFYSIWFLATVLEFWLYQTVIISILPCSWLWGIHSFHIIKYTLSSPSVKWLWPSLMNSDCWMAWEGFYILLRSRGLQFTF